MRWGGFFLGEVFPQLLSDFTCNNNHKAKDFFFFFSKTDFDERQDEQCPAIFVN